MSPEIKCPRRARAMVLVFLAVVPNCSSALQSSPNDGGGGASIPAGRDGSAGTGGSGGSAGTGGSGGSAGTGGTIGELCTWSSAEKPCPAGQVCLRECYGDSFLGRCVALPTACDSSLNPVCGCDGRTYANECLLQQVPKQKDYDGACVFTTSALSGYVVPLEGVWSGPGIRMNVTATGATISIGCASGTIDQPLTLAPRFYTTTGPITRGGSWQGTLSVIPASVTYAAVLFEATLRLDVVDQSWMLRYEDLGAPPCP